MNNNSNNNRGNNNRRRGRGNRQQGGGGSGNQNRIDSRARGNAPQMLDKYKKLAQDAAHNGDRVQAEYYLQFADHYFRVIADNRVRQDEVRGPRREERDFASDGDGDDFDFDMPRSAREDRPREDRPREERRDERPREDRAREERPREDRERGDRPRDGRGERNRGERSRAPREQESGATPDREEGERGTETGTTEYEPAENPFVRPTRSRDTARRPRRPTTDETAEMTGDTGGIDAAALPPAFSAAPVSAAPASEDEPERATRKLPPRRRRKPAEDAGDAGDSLTAVG